MAKLPDKAQILAWVAENPTKGSKRDIAKAFGIKGAARIDLKRLLKELEAEGHLEKRRKTYRDPDSLPPVSVLEVLEGPPGADLFARPLEWRGEGEEPKILYMPRKADPALGAGDRILSRLTKVQGEDYAYEARLIRRIGATKRKILGVFRAGSDGGRIVPIDKGADKEWHVPSRDDHGAKDGELVEAEQAGPKGRMGLPRARITARLGDPSAAKSVSLIAIHEHGIPDAFHEDTLAEAEAATTPDIGDREDLRDLSLVTIDPADARDHDDACWAEPDPDPKNPGGHILWVAIADVAHFVRPGSALDQTARTRGNSTYFPDRVVPMLPDALSGDLCSLHEGVDRPCIVARMVIDAEGEMTEHRFIRAMMRSPASLNYEEVQAAQDGKPNARTKPFLDSVIRPLYAAFDALERAREKRQPLDLDLPERRIELSDAGEVTSVNFKDRLDAHRLIEAFMVLANVAAAKALEKKKTPLLYRVHEEPAPTKLDALREVAQAAGFGLAKGQVLSTRQLNTLLAQARESEDAELISLATLRSMTQAYYSPENFGHFGLALRSYAHFTSPIRRYSDLIVHRALISAYGWGDDGLTEADIGTLEETAAQISETERRSMSAERDTTDRYLAAFLADRVGADFAGRISGIARFGVFVKLEETGADGLIPMRALGGEYFHYDRDAQTLMGADSGRVISMGLPVTVRLAEATPVTGGLILDLLSLDGKSMGNSPRRGRKPPRRSGRKVTRTRRR